METLFLIKIHLNPNWTMLNYLADKSTLTQNAINKQSKSFKIKSRTPKKSH
jgi:hypothetical protein